MIHKETRGSIIQSGSVLNIQHSHLFAIKVYLVGCSIEAKGLIMSSGQVKTKDRKTKGKSMMDMFVFLHLLHFFNKKH